jgi:proline iminopeptidase
LAWHDTERVLSEVAPTQTRLNIVPSHSLPNSPFIEAHYFQNGCFLGQKGLLENVGRLHGIPGVMVQGRYDLLCPPATSFALANLWPQAEVVVAEMSGHSLQHPAVHQQVKEAISRFDGNRFALA